MIVGCDIDGVLTPVSARIRFRLPWWVFACLVFISPNKRMLGILISLSANHKIVLVSSRPKQLNWLTQWWLKRNYVPYSSLFLVGLEPGIEQRKLEIIWEEKIDLFIDDDEKIVIFLREHSINALSPEGVFLKISTPFSFFKKMIGYKIIK